MAECLYHVLIHPTASQATRHWCLAYWREAACWSCAALYDACPYRRPSLPYDAEGLHRLNRRIVRDAVRAAQAGMLDQVEIAVHWAVIDGMDEQVARRAVWKAVADG